MASSRRTVTRERYRQITTVALVLLAFIIVTGAAVRLTGSGLGCSDWPTCEEDQLVAEVDDVHAMVEFVNRVITGLVSLAVMAAVLGSLRRVPRRADLVHLSWGLVVGVIAQILLGALVVREHLPPELVMGHFLVSMVLVWNAMVLRHRAGLPDDWTRAPPHPLRWHVRSLSLAAAAVLISGTFVTGSGPHSGAETQQTREALEARGVDVAGLDPSQLEVERLPFDVPDVARVHGVIVMVLLATTLWLVLRLHRGPFARLFRRSQTLIAVLVLQAAIGYVQYFSGVPALLVGVHVAGAVAAWVATLDLHLHLSVAPDRAPPARSEPTVRTGTMDR